MWGMRVKRRLCAGWISLMATAVMVLSATGSSWAGQSARAAQGSVSGQAGVWMPTALPGHALYPGTTGGPTDGPDSMPGPGAPPAPATSPDSAANPGVSPAPAPQPDKKGKKAEPKKEDPEVVLGRRVAAEIERETKLVRDPQQLARLERIGRDIAAVCDAPQYKYTFKILDTEEINAISLPGGFTYVTKAMMSYVRSDDELAGVLAHEIAHAARHHVKELLGRESRANQGMLLGILGAVLLGGGRSGGFGNVVMGAAILKSAYLSGYSQKAESEADRVGLEYLLKTGKYNPVGELTVLERLARDEARQAGPNPGVFRTHPPGMERARTLEEMIRARGIPINRLAVQDQLRASVRETLVGQNTSVEVIQNGVVILQTAVGVDAAQQIADRINRLMDTGIQMRDVRVGGDGVSVVAQGVVLFSVTEADAALHQKTPAEVAAAAAHNLSLALWKVYMDQVF